MLANEGITVDSVYAALLGRDKKSLRAAKPSKHGLYAYMWRMVRFHTGIDMTMPCTCFWDLADFVESKGFTRDQVNVSGIINANGRELLDLLEPMIDEVSIKFGKNPFKAAVRWGRALGYTI